MTQGKLISCIWYFDLSQRCEIFKKELLQIIESENIIQKGESEKAKKIAMERIENVIN